MTRSKNPFPQSHFPTTPTSHLLSRACFQLTVLAKITESKTVLPHEGSRITAAVGIKWPGWQPKDETNKNNFLQKVPLVGKEGLWFLDNKPTTSKSDGCCPKYYNPIDQLLCKYSAIYISGPKKDSEVLTKVFEAFKNPTLHPPPPGPGRCGSIG